ncbi:DeoR/GlpR family DNA-binding transcription regulator [Fictibacillus phosphorivorans]|uniref:DeoR/GlpR family DNA-binding transcription regulator n=1 Tax=Fictibacillus phosphorivorans TaxID=1221500 RepID=UPI00203A3DE5|nr:DeoR/GlpR family DNA-binding transcription regulator [Fictibacillus phosphorivorans]MCM3717783.1 DeoR/GlpR family DNA-binding transcription regulator [Fictibacillus phosphorivorans]MCM3777011.1 DeoR/GlpR family DNA-binding transcription regulator [Fictibacillus phosphorivorans]
MIVIERRNKIREILFKKRSVKVTELVHEFQVSEETIRRDLIQLEKEGLVQKNYGGAILMEDLQKTQDIIMPVQLRELQFFTEKDAIGQRAAQFVQEGQIIILDAGSTTWCMARHLHDIKQLTVITNALNVIEECSKNESASIFMLGGELRRNSKSMIGPQTQMEIQKYNADYVFLGASGISLRQGFTSLDLYEAQIKQAMAAAGKKIVLMADHSKLQKTGLVSFCSFEDVDYLITSDKADELVLKEIEKYGVEVIITSTIHS